MKKKNEVIQEIEDALAKIKSFLDKREMVKVVGQLINKQQNITEYYDQQIYSKFPQLMTEINKLSGEVELQNKEYIEDMRQIAELKMNTIFKKPYLSGMQNELSKILEEGERRMEKMQITPVPSQSPSKATPNILVYIYIYIHIYNIVKSSGEVPHRTTFRS